MVSMALAFNAAVFFVLQGRALMLRLLSPVVGESGQQETAITVTGLKPNHFYNIRVIAVGPNNFQAGSQVIRLRTFGRNGRPELGNSRLPASFLALEEQRSSIGDSGDDSAGVKNLVPSIEAAPALDGVSSVTRDGGSSAAGQRRNTVNRRHSPSMTSADQPVIKQSASEQPEQSLQELTDRFERTRKEIEDTIAQNAQEEREFKQLEDELKREKEKKKQIQKEKDDNTEQLRKRVNLTYEQMRSAEKDKARKEKLLKDKQSKRTKIHESIAKWDADIDNMRRKRESFEAGKSTLQDDRDLRVKNLEDENAAVLEDCSRLETELKQKRDQLKQLEEARKSLPGGEEDEGWKDADRDMRRTWELKRRELHGQLLQEQRRTQHLDNHLQLLYAQLQAQQQSGLGLYSQANSSGVDFDLPSQTQMKRRSRGGNSLSNVMLSSPTGQYSGVDTSFAAPAGFSGRTGFVPGPFMDMSAADSIGMDQSFTEADLRALTAGAPLSPTATSLLPSGILGDDDPPSPSSRSKQSPFAPLPVLPSLDNDPQSPASSGRSISILSSPHGSSYNLPFPQYTGESGDRRSLPAGVATSPSGLPGPASSHRLTSLLLSFQRSRGAKAIDEGGPPIGSLKHGQSQSFPRQTDETELLGNRRRISFSSGWFNRNSTGAELGDAAAPLAAKGFSARRLIPFGNSSSGASSFFAARDPSSPRPASIGSTDLPRPSTDSGSIWNAPGEGAMHSRFWAQPDTMWSSRNPSRRPSIHGSPSALKTTLASAEDEILDEEALLDPQVSPSQVGVIGSRPPGISKTLAQRLNPAAPTFMTGLFRPKTDKEKENSKEKDKSKSKEKEKGKDKSKEKESTKGKGRDASSETPQTVSTDDSPSDSRQSRDTYSVHTQTSVSESRESLTLDRTLSSTPSEPTTTSTAANLREQDNVVRKLFRKGSSSKFSLSSRLGKDSGLFKKGPGSTTNSDKNFSAEISSVGDADELGEDAGPPFRGYDSVTSSPSLGPAKGKDKEKEGRMSGWRFSMKKKGKENKESLELERDRPSESEHAE
jgi:hypothetical protein